MNQEKTIIHTEEQTQNISVAGLTYAYADLAKSFSEVIRSIELAREDSAVQDVELICLERELSELDALCQLFMQEVNLLHSMVLRPIAAKAFAENPDAQPAQ